MFFSFLCDSLTCDYFSLLLQHGHPYISAMVNNGSLSYDHDRDGTHTELAGCEAKFRNVDHDTHVVIRYENDILTVSASFCNALLLRVNCLDGVM